MRSVSLMVLVAAVVSAKLNLKVEQVQGRQVGKFKPGELIAELTDKVR